MSFVICVLKNRLDIIKDIQTYVIITRTFSFVFLGFLHFRFQRKKCWSKLYTDKTFSKCNLGISTTSGIKVTDDIWRWFQGAAEAGCWLASERNLRFIYPTGLILIDQLFISKLIFVFNLVVLILYFSSCSLFSFFRTTN